MTDPEFALLVQQECALLGAAHPDFSGRVLSALVEGQVTRDYLVDPAYHVNGVASLYGHACAGNAREAYTLLQESKPVIRAYNPKWQCYGTPLSSLNGHISPGEHLEEEEEGGRKGNPFLHFVAREIQSYQKRSVLPKKVPFHEED